MVFTTFIIYLKIYHSIALLLFILIKTNTLILIILFFRQPKQYTVEFSFTLNETDALILRIDDGCTRNTVTDRDILISNDNSGIITYSLYINSFLVKDLETLQANEQDRIKICQEGDTDIKNVLIQSCKDLQYNIGIFTLTYIY